MTVRVVLNLERDYRIEYLGFNDKIEKSLDLNKEELVEVMKELADKLEEKNALEVLRATMIFKPKNITFRFKE